MIPTAEDHDTALARAARAEIARRTARFSAWPGGAPRPGMITRPPNEIAIERWVFGLCHVLLWPLRQISGAVSRDRRRRGTAAGTATD